MDKKVVSSSHHEDLAKSADGPRGSISNKIVAVGLAASAILAGAIEMFSGSTDRPANLKQAQGQFVGKLKGIFDSSPFDSSPSEEELKEIFKLELASRSPARRVDILLSELTFTLADFIAVYDDYQKAAAAGDNSLAEKKQKVYRAVTKVITAIRNGATMPPDPRAPRVLADCERSMKVLREEFQQLPERRRGEMVEWSPDAAELDRLRAMVNELPPSTKESESAGLGISADPDSFHAAELIIGEYLEANSETQALSSADTSTVGGG